MANQTGRPIAPARKLVAAVLGCFAVFVMVFGLGLSSGPVVALGGALLALAIALGMVNVVRRGARAWVAGHGQVKAISEAPASGAYGRAELQLVVVAPGLPVTEVIVREPRVPVGKWPRPGETLPVTVDVDDMRRVRIDWGQVDDRNDDGDPPPPAGSDSSFESEYESGYESGFESGEEVSFDDDLLGDPEPPPWQNRDRSWGRGPDEPAPAADHNEFVEERQTSTIVVHDTPAGPVLEGHLVDEEEIPEFSRSVPRARPQLRRTRRHTPLLPPMPPPTPPRRPPLRPPTPPQLPPLPPVPPLPPAPLPKPRPLPLKRPRPPLHRTRVRPPKPRAG